jgi:hypothetical protein
VHRFAWLILRHFNRIRFCPVGTCRRWPEFIFPAGCGLIERRSIALP